MIKNARKWSNHLKIWSFLWISDLKKGQYHRKLSFSMVFIGFCIQNIHISRPQDPCTTLYICVNIMLCVCVCARAHIMLCVCVFVCILFVCVCAHILYLFTNVLCFCCLCVQLDSDLWSLYRPVRVQHKPVWRLSTSLAVAWIALAHSLVRWGLKEDTREIQGSSEFVGSVWQGGFRPWICNLRTF